MKTYNIQLSEDKIAILKNVLRKYISDNNGIEDTETEQYVLDLLEQAKQRPYTNFDKIKEEMTIDRFIKFSCGNEAFIAQETGTEIGNKSYKEWLESEV